MKLNKALEVGPYNLTGRELAMLEIITGLFDENGNLLQEYTDNVQQHGIDLNVIKVERIVGPGFIPKEGKTKMADRAIVMPTIMEEKKVWLLEPGAYDLTFKQGCKIPDDQKLNIIHRSSTLRNAGKIVSGNFDAGFETTNMGAILFLEQPMIIEVGARVAQANTYRSNKVDNLYEGQWQGDKQRNS